jgi:hypothetical protein
VHEISTKQIGMMAVSLVLVLGACGGESVTGPTLVSTPPPPVTLIGTWRGGDGDIGLVWQLTQEGDRIIGTSEIVGRDGWTTAGGRVEGTVTGSTFTFSASHTAGNVSEAGCSRKLQGTLTLREPVTAPPSTPPTSYPAPYPTSYPRGEPFVPPLPPPARAMFGPVTGNDCDGSFDTTIRLFKD